MRATMMLADHAQVADGKLFIAGGGWSLAGPGPIPCGIALLFHVPWQQTNERTAFMLRLLDEDGRPFPGTGEPGGPSGQAGRPIAAGAAPPRGPRGRTQGPRC